tara:strand:+ start:304 stop:948 length:645 start_codon:yes stop_codon:yes gene_type:complete
MNNLIILIIFLFCSCCLVTFFCFKKNYENFSAYNISNNDKKKFIKGKYESTYGTLEKNGLKTIIKKVGEYKNNDKWINDKVFIDLGSGEGKVSIFALDYPFNKSLGVELSTDRHNMAINKKNKLSKDKQNRIFFYNIDLLKYNLEEVDLIYISSLCFNSKFLEKISDKLSKELKNGSIICTSSELSNDSLKFIDSYDVEQSWSKNSIIYMYEKI